MENIFDLLNRRFVQIFSTCYQRVWKMKKFKIYHLLLLYFIIFRHSSYFVNILTRSAIYTIKLPDEKNLMRLKRGKKLLWGHSIIKYSLLVFRLLNFLCVSQQVIKSSLLIFIQKYLFLQRESRRSTQSA